MESSSSSSSSSLSSSLFYCRENNMKTILNAENGGLPTRLSRIPENWDSFNSRSGIPEN